MKRKVLLLIVVLLLVVAFSSVALIGCDNTDDDAFTIKVCVPDGSPAIAIAKLLKDKPTFDGYNIEYEIVTGSEGIGARLASGEATIAIAPTNAGATQYNKNNGKYKLVATAVQGALYMVGKEQLSGNTTQEKLNSLMGKTLYNIGQGATPDLTFKYILDYYQIPYRITDVESDEYIALQYVSEGSALIQNLKMGIASYGILGEPAVTNANKATGTTTLFSIQDLWDDVNNATSGFPQASVFVNSQILGGEHDEFLNWFVGKLEENSTWVKTNASEAGLALQEGGSTSLKALTNEMVTKCNINIIRANNAKESVTTYLTALHGFNPQTVGGSVPNNEFYYAV